MYKQVIIVRKDLKMNKGKLAVQVAHASLGSFKKANKKVVHAWEREGGKKVVLKADLRKLKDIHKKAKRNKFPCFLVMDAGLTQIKAGTITALGIGPVEDEKIDEITGRLKLL